LRLILPSATVFTDILCCHCYALILLLSPLQELTRQNGEGIARSILAMSEMHTCPDPDQFVRSLRDMFNGLDPEVIRTRTSEVLQDMIEELRQHQVGGQGGSRGHSWAAVVRLSGWECGEMHFLRARRFLQDDS
jgi:hypothetical protein